MQNFTVSEHEKLNTAVALGFLTDFTRDTEGLFSRLLSRRKTDFCPCALHLLKARRRFSENLLRVRL